MIGVSAIFMAWIFSPRQVSAPSMESFRSHGFVFQSTEMIDLNQSEFKLAFSEINCENGTIKCEIIITPLLNKSSEYSSAFFYSKFLIVPVTLMLSF
jgi:hypothetical protein